MAEITIFTVKNCPRCDQLKKILPKGYQEQNMTEPDALSHLRCHDIFTMAAPVLEVDEIFFTVDSIFTDGNLNMKAINHILRDALKRDVELVKNSLKGEGWDYQADIVERLYQDNCDLSKRLEDLTELNYSLMGNCNQLRSRATTAESELERLKKI